MTALGCQRNNAQRTSTSAHKFERRGNHDCARWRKLIQIPETGQPKLSGTVHDAVIGKWRIECSCLSRVGAHSFNADAEHVAILREEK
jgi:hypothetical protein